MSDNHTPPNPEDMGEHLDEDIKETVEDWASSTEEELDDLSDRVDQKLRRTVSGWVGAGDDADWKDIGTNMDAKTRAAIGGWVGAEEGADWNEISSRMENRIRVGVARMIHAQEAEQDVAEASWSDIGQKIEHDVRGWVASLVGTQQDADWPAIGNRVVDQVRSAFDKATKSGKDAAADKPYTQSQKIDIEADEAPPATREDIPPAITGEEPVEPLQ